MNIGGDCRYWPVSCWKQMLFGYKYLLANPSEAEEYVHNIDAHSLALTCLQMMVEVTSGPEPPHAAALFSAFRRYWADATRFHAELYAVFQGHGTFANLKKSFLQQQIAERTHRNLERLKLALDEIASSVCSSAEEALFYRALQRMLCGRQVEWIAVHNILHEKKTTSPPRRFTHRRVRTTDGGNSMSRNVPEVNDTRLLRFGPQEPASGASSPSHLPTKEAESAQDPEPETDVFDTIRQWFRLRKHRRTRSVGATMQQPLADEYATEQEFKADQLGMPIAGERLRKISEWSADEEQVGLMGSA